MSVFGISLYFRINFMFFSHGLVTVTQMDISCIGLIVSSSSLYG
jgi:hypothetical protein